jgi:hypothetical protein
MRAPVGSGRVGRDGSHGKIIGIARIFGQLRIFLIYGFLKQVIIQIWIYYLVDKNTGEI